MRGQLGFILLCLWLILFGMVMALSLTFQWQGAIMGCMAIASGVLLLIGRYIWNAPPGP